MNEVPDRNDDAVPAATRELAQLERQAATLRAMLIRLHEDVITAEARLAATGASELVEANQQLVLAMVQAQADADAAAIELHEISHATTLDALTQLPNRARVLERLAQAITEAEACGGRFALLFVDLNNFKQINDTLGHTAGDGILRLAADRLASCVGAGDTVSRYGGDEFLILLTRVRKPSDAIQAADAVVLALGAPHRVGSHVVRLTASIGISMYPDDGQDADTLIDLADVAMYHAKRRGLASFAFHGMEPTGLRTWEVPALESLQHPVSHYELAMEEHERRHAQMRETNEQLLLAALDAQDLQAAAMLAHRQQTEFLATLAHELRNPLAPIRNAAAMISGVRSDELPRLQAVIERQGAQLSRLVNDLLDVSRVSTGKLRVQQMPIDLAPVIDSAIEACRPAMDTRLQTFTVQVTTGALEVNGDPVRLAQVLSNLLDNASKYTPNGGEIALSVVVGPEGVVLTVSDNGIGISPATLPRIFAPFVQDAHAVIFNKDGLGIGLTVVRELVEAHGGTVVASSAGTGLGSEFMITLPSVAS